MPPKTKPAGGNGGNHSFIASDWKPYAKNTLRGFFTIITPSGLRIKECALHEKEKKKWIGLPARSWTKKDGSLGYIPLIDFVADDIRKRFQREALAAVAALLAGEGGPA